MGEVALILQNVKKNKNDFEKLINMMTPLINKYTRLLYKDEKEDINSELILALWEAVLKMKLNKIAARWPAKAVAQFFYFF